MDISRDVVGRYFAICFHLLNMMPPLGPRMTFFVLVKKKKSPFFFFPISFSPHIVIKYLLSVSWNLLGRLPSMQLPSHLWLHLNSGRDIRKLIPSNRHPSSFRRPGSGWRQKEVLVLFIKVFVVIFRNLEDFYPFFFFTCYSSFWLHSFTLDFSLDHAQSH